MAATIRNCPRAVATSVYIIRAFVKLRVDQADSFADSLISALAHQETPTAVYLRMSWRIKSNGQGWFRKLPDKGVRFRWD